MSAPQVIFEATVVGASLLAVAAVVHVSHMAVAKENAMSHRGLAAQTFLSGFLLHTLCEVTGINRRYCAFFPGNRAA